MNAQLERAGRLIKAATGETYGDGEMVTNIGVGIAEPGYPHEAIWVSGDWNPKRFSGPPLSNEESLAPRLAEALERRVPGIKLLWLDEWTQCDECMRAIRTEPDSYSWLPSFIVTEAGGTYCLEHVEWDDIESTFLNEPTRAITFDFDLEAQGFERYIPSATLPGHYVGSTFHNGWHPGQDGDPKAVWALAQSDGWRDGVFKIPHKGQFDMAFELWVRNREEERCAICNEPIEYVGTVDPGGNDHGWSHVDFDDGLEHKAMRPRDPNSPTGNEECGSCGGDIGPSTSYPWHLANEDCRAIRNPLEQMTMEPINTAEEARDKAIAWQLWQSEQSLSMSELVDWQGYFEELAERFGLVEEFTEEGII